MTRKAFTDLLAETRTRSEIKALAARFEDEPELRALALAIAAERGIELDEEASDKRLIRALLDRAEAAQVVRTPTRRDAAFRCAWCAALVEAGGGRVRDHCPRCLRGLHVDVVPGDRAADCGAVLEPVAMRLAGRDGVLVSWRCVACGHSYEGRAHPDDQLPATLDVADLPGPLSPPVEDAVVDRARTLPLRLVEALRRGRLWSPGQRVVVAVSGGLDSSVLLELLHRTAGAHKGQLTVASVDHGLRPEAIAEVAQVGRRARALGLDFRALSLGLEAGPNLAERAREARRAALLGLGADRIATAHHEDDQAETVLYHLLRGSGAAGLAGMRALDPPWCRPLLGEPRAVLLAWAQAEGLRWVEDPSNAGSQRGQLRALWPALEAIQGGLSGALARSARLLAREDALLERIVDEGWPRLAQAGGLSLAGLRAEDPALYLRYLRRLCAEAGLSAPRAERLEAALAFTGEEGEVELGGGVRLRFGEGHVSLVT